MLRILKSSFNNTIRLVQCKKGGTAISASIHTSKSKNHIKKKEISMKKRKFKNNNFPLTAVFHGDFEWQDPKSEDEM